MTLLRTPSLTPLYPSKALNLDVEILRAMAILLTLVQHLDYLIFWTPGWHVQLKQWFGFWSGVDLFFVISGYVIVRSLHDSHGKLAGPSKSFNAFAFPFWMKRASRLWPAAWLWAGLSVLCALIFSPSGVFGRVDGMAMDALSAVLQLANVHWSLCSSGGSSVCNLTTVAAIDGAGMPNLHSVGWVLAGYWSLSLEEQFYVLLPVLLFAVPRKFFLWVMLAIALAQMCFPRPPLSPLWYFRTDGLILGVLIGLWSLSAHNISRVWWVKTCSRMTKTTAWILLVVTLIGIAFLSSPRFFNTLWATAAITSLCVWLLALASLDLGMFCPKGALGQASLWLGSRSYSLYLAHLPVFGVCLALAFEWGLIASVSQVGFAQAAYVFLAVTVVFGMAELSYQWIELPLRNRGRRWVEKRYPC